MSQARFPQPTIPVSEIQDIRSEVSSIYGYFSKQIPVLDLGLGDILIIEAHIAPRCGRNTGARWMGSVSHIS